MITKIVTSAELHDYTQKGYVIKSEFDEEVVKTLEHKDLVPDDKANPNYYVEKPLKLTKQVLEQKVLKIRKFVITIDPSSELALLTNTIEKLSCNLSNIEFQLETALKSEKEANSKLDALNIKYKDLENSFNRENRELLAANSRAKEAELQVQKAMKAFGELKWSEAMRGK